MRAIMCFALFSLNLMFLGCGGGGEVTMTTEFSEEQKAAMQAETEAVFEEESQGVVNRKSKKVK